MSSISLVKYNSAIKYGNRKMFYFLIRPLIGVAIVLYGGDESKRGAECYLTKE